MNKNEISQYELIMEGIEVLVETADAFLQLNKKKLTYGMMLNIIINFISNFVSSIIVETNLLSIESKLHAIDKITKHFNITMDNLRKEIHKNGRSNEH